MGLGERAAIATIVATAITLVTVEAAALPSARFVYLRGKDTESCPTELELREAVQTRLGYDPFSSYAASTMFAEVTATTGGFTASLKLLDGENVVRGDRVLRVRGRCAELIGAMARSLLPGGRTARSHGAETGEAPVFAGRGPAREPGNGARSLPSCQ